jgi:hypothetical protein
VKGNLVQTLSIDIKWMQKLGSRTDRIVTTITILKNTYELVIKAQYISIYYQLLLEIV